jgi:hypothetical protein
MNARERNINYEIRANGTSKIAMALARSSNDNTSSFAEAQFSQRMAASHSVWAIPPEYGLKKLAAAFQYATSEDSRDPYYLSPAYYALTGRRGLWRYAINDSSALLVCLHPNKINTVLLFPPLGNSLDNLIDRFLQDFQDINGIEYRLSRVTDDQRHLFERIKGEWIREEILDWRFPVHVISCKDLLEMRGKEYRIIRGSNNKFNPISVVDEIEFNSEKSIARASRIARSWEESTRHYTRYDVDVDYFSSLFNIGASGALPIKGKIVSIDGRDVGLSVWENPVSSNGTANLFATQVADGDSRLNNLSTFLVLSSVRQMHADGVKFACPGGSETEGMDSFKRKFVPAWSVNLHTCILET